MQSLVLEVGCCYNKYLKNVEVAQGQGSQIICRGWKNLKEHERKSLDCLKYTSDRNRDAESTAGDGSEVRNAGNLDGAGPC